MKDTTPDQPIRDFACTDADPFSYRESHQGKGSDYYDFCNNNPYTRFLWRHESRILRRLVQGLPASGKSTYLDFACGTGRILSLLAPLTGHATGVDISETMLEVAKEQLPTVVLEQADLTLEDGVAVGPFDLITAFRFFLNAEPTLRVAAIRAVVRRMHRNSLLIFNVHRNAGSLTHRLLRLSGRTERELHYMAKAEVIGLTAPVGLKLVDTYHIGVLPATEQRMPLPALVMHPFERVFSAARPLASLANDIIYVFKRA